MYSIGQRVLVVATIFYRYDIVKVWSFFRNCGC